MKAKKGYCNWYGCSMNQITEEEQEDCDYENGDCIYCDQYKKPLNAEDDNEDDMY